jgi:hypothetical protein
MLFGSFGLIMSVWFGFHFSFFSRLHHLLPQSAWLALLKRAKTTQTFMYYQKQGSVLRGAMSLLRKRLSLRAMLPPQKSQPLGRRLSQPDVFLALWYALPNNNSLVSYLFLFVLLSYPHCNVLDQDASNTKILLLQKKLKKAEALNRKNTNQETGIEREFPSPNLYMSLVSLTTCRRDPRPQRP